MTRGPVAANRWPSTRSREQTTGRPLGAVSRDHVSNRLLPFVFPGPSRPVGWRLWGGDRRRDGPGWVELVGRQRASAASPCPPRAHRQPIRRCGVSFGGGRSGRGLFAVLLPVSARRSGWERGFTEISTNKRRLLSLFPFRRTPLLPPVSPGVPPRSVSKSRIEPSEAMDVDGNAPKTPVSF